MKSKPSNIESSPYQVQVLDRALSILEVLSDSSPEVSLTEICEQVRLHKSTVHRLLMVLGRHRLVAKSSQNGKYRLGLKLFELGSRAIAQFGLRECTRSYLERLVFETGETAHVCILDQGEMLSVANVESPRAIRTPSTVGRRTPLHCTAVGKAVLAFLPASEIDEVVKRRGLRPYTSKTITSPAEFKAELRFVRERGYAVDNEEFEEGLKCISAPIRNYSGQVSASISIAGPAFRLDKDKTVLLAQSVIKAASELSIELGYRRVEAPEAGKEKVFPRRSRV